MNVLIQTGLPIEIPEIPWAAISPELTLFGVGLLALLLDTAGRNRLQSAFIVFGALTAGAGYALWATDHVVVPAVIIGAAVAQFALTALLRQRPRMLGAVLAALGFAACMGVTGWQWIESRGEVRIVTESLLADMVAVDGIALFARIVVCLAGLLTVFLGFSYAEERRIHRGEYYPLLLFAATGMTLLASAADLIMVFIAIEIFSLALYILCGFAKRDLNSQESALKYFLLGAFSSALLLYGIALTYGVTGSTNLAAAGRAIAFVGSPDVLSVAAIGLLLVGFAFKTSLVPFHMWTPDVYQGAPTPVTGFMAAATKTAAFAAFLRIFVGALGPMQWTWVPLLWLIAALTMIVGAVLAVVQTDVKRILAYSSVAHAGYVAIGVIAVTREGISGTLFYLFVYTFIILGAFGVLGFLERRQHKALAIADLAGLGRRYPVPAAMFGLFLLALAGIPPTAGFAAKFAVFRAGVEAGLARGDNWLVALVVIAVVSSMIAAFFYIRLIWAMFMEDEPEGELRPLVPTAGVSAGLALATAATVFLGLRPGEIIELARQAASVLA